MLLAKTELNTIAVLISAAWIDSYINHNEFVSVNNVLQKYNDMKEEIKFVKIVPVLRKIQQTKTLISKKLTKMNYCLYKTVVFVARKNRGLLKMKKQD